ncbi:MAG: MFS transporter [Cyanobacteria bacterium J06639_1]
MALPTESPTPAPDNPRSPEPPGTDPRENGFWHVLRDRDFLALWSGQVFSQLADKVFLVLAVAIVSANFQPEGESISRWVSAVMIAFTIPAILFGSVAGVYVDRWSKKAVMVATNVLRGVLVLGIPALLWVARDWPSVGAWPLGFVGLLAVVFAVSTLTQFFAPAEQSAIPAIVESRYLLSANSLYTTTMMASVIVGFAIGEPLLGLANRLASRWFPQYGDLGADVAVGAGYILAGIILILMQVNEGDRRSRAGRRVWEDIREGLDYLTRAPRVRGAIVQLVVLFSIFAALAVLAVRMAETIPNLGTAQFGILLAATGVGLALGAFVVGEWGDRFARETWSQWGLGGVTLMLGAIAASPRLLSVSLALIALLGFFAAWVGVPMQTTIQDETPVEMRGKVFGLQNNVVNIALSLPLALAGIAETRFGLSPVLWGLAATAAIAALLTRNAFDSEPLHVVSEASPTDSPDATQSAEMGDREAVTTQ